LSTMQTNTPAGQTVQRYAIDPAHTTVEFVVRHLMITKVRGRFAGVSGGFVLPQGTTLPQDVDITIDTASVDTREAQRDAHLRSPDFLDVERFPAMTYRSTRVEGTPDAFRIHGELTLHGITREVVLQAEFEGQGSDPWGGKRVGYSAHASINRKDFGLTWNQALEAGGVVVGDEVRIELNVQAKLEA